MNKQVYLPDLPVFNAIKKSSFLLKHLPLENIAFVCAQHELATTINLVDTLIYFGANPENIYLTGKHYSSCSAVADKLMELGINRQPSSEQSNLGDFARVFKYDIKMMWNKFLEQLPNKSVRGIIILDDGGRCMAAVPNALHMSYPIVAIEQTTGGIANPDTIDLPYPIIEVASSAAKLWLESPIIAAAAITERLDTILRSSPNKPSCGVIGTGSIGAAVVKKLLSLGYKVMGYDKNIRKACEFNGFSWVSSIEEVIKNTQYIFGCTGFDITSMLDFSALIDSNKTFFSCSSEDREFLTLLKLVQKQNPNYKADALRNVYYRTDRGYYLKIARSGFPITFDGGPQPAPAMDIQLTQGLLFCAIIQAIVMLPVDALSNKKARVMLDPVIQQFVCSVWGKSQPPGRYAEDLLQRFNDFRWIMDHSGGQYCPAEKIHKFFGQGLKVNA